MLILLYPRKTASDAYCTEYCIGPRPVWTSARSLVAIPTEGGMGKTAEDPRKAGVFLTVGQKSQVDTHQCHSTQSLGSVSFCSCVKLSTCSGIHYTYNSPTMYSLRLKILSGSFPWRNSALYLKWKSLHVSWLNSLRDKKKTKTSHCSLQHEIDFQKEDMNIQNPFPIQSNHYSISITISFEIQVGNYIPVDTA
jgi:hypothetical protein